MSLEPPCNITSSYETEKCYKSPFLSINEIVWGLLVYDVEFLSPYRMTTELLVVT